MTSRKKTSTQLVRDVIGSFIEEEGADAVVVIYSKVKRLKTQTFLIPWGNAHTCNALIDYAYEKFSPPTREPEQEEPNDED